MTRRIPQPPLLLVTDRRQARRPLTAIVAAALDAGCRWVSLREKDLPADEQILLARSLLALVHTHGGKLMLHGEAALARDAGMDGVHLPSGRDATAARALIGADKILGVSIHTVTEAERIDPAHVDYALAGPAFETPSKPGYGPALGTAALRAAAEREIPVLALGGVTTETAGACLAAGARGVAVMGEIMRADDPAETVGDLVRACEGAGR